MSERVDLDRLADYVGGALDGTPDAAEVRAARRHRPGVGRRARRPRRGDVVGQRRPSCGRRSRRPPYRRTWSPGWTTSSVTSDLPPKRAERDADAASAAARDRSARRTAARRPRGPAAPGRERGASGPGGTGPGRDRKRADGAVGGRPVGGRGRDRVRRRGRWRRSRAVDNGRREHRRRRRGRDADGAVAGGRRRRRRRRPANSGRDYRAGSFDGLGRRRRAGAVTRQPSGARESRPRPRRPTASRPPRQALPPELARFRRRRPPVEACLDAIRQVFGGVGAGGRLRPVRGPTGGRRAARRRAQRATDGRWSWWPDRTAEQIRGDADEVFHGPSGVT